MFPVNGFPVDTNQAIPVAASRSAYPRNKSVPFLRQMERASHRCLSSCRPQRSNAATRSQPLCFAQYTRLPSICLLPLPPWAPLGSEERSRHPDRCPLRVLIGSRTRLSGYPVPVDRLRWHYYGVEVKKGCYLFDVLCSCLVFPNFT